MRLHIGKHLATKEASRLKKKLRIRRRVHGSAERPRLCVFRSARHIYAQLIDDTKGATIASTSTLQVEGMKGANKNSAKTIGAEIAKLAKAKNINSVVFDRNGYLYHGRIQALAEGAREAGLEF
ncbi:MAG: 50S ribosomal protein L18 [Bdellovibrionaceae bacterium]|nr:50S ribosomal protein L18 [Pseudobdellovibrionaceae bacterium]